MGMLKGAKRGNAKGETGKRGVLRVNENSFFLLGFCEATARNFSCVREAKKIKRKKRYRTNKSLNLAFG